MLPVPVRTWGCDYDYGHAFDWLATFSPFDEQHKSAGKVQKIGQPGKFNLTYWVQPRCGLGYQEEKAILQEDVLKGKADGSTSEDEA